MDAHPNVAVCRKKRKKNSTAKAGRRYCVNSVIVNFEEGGRKIFFLALGTCKKEGRKGGVGTNVGGRWGGRGKEKKERSIYGRGKRKKETRRKTETEEVAHSEANLNSEKQEGHILNKNEMSDTRTTREGFRITASEITAKAARWPYVRPRPSMGPLDKCRLTSPFRTRNQKDEGGTNYKR